MPHGTSTAWAPSGFLLADGGGPFSTGWIAASTARAHRFWTVVLVDREPIARQHMPIAPMSDPG